MAKKPTNSGKPWTDRQVEKLEELAGENTPTRLIALEIRLELLLDVARQRSALGRPGGSKGRIVLGDESVE